MRQDWQIRKLSEVCQIKPPKKEAKELLSETDLVSFIPMNDLGVRQKSFSHQEEKSLGKVVGSYTYFAENDVLLAKITPCFENGKLGIARGLRNGIGFGSSEYVVFRSKGDIDPEYLFYFLSQDSFRDAGAKVMTGAVGHKRVPKEFIEDYLVPLPRFEEQKRIVAILDEAFAGIDTAIANTEKNLANARELFESYLNSVFSQRGEGWSENKRVSDKRSTQSTHQEKMVCTASLELNNGKATKTGGRDATMRHIPGELSLSVGMPSTGARNGWKWSPLSDLARLESGHTPSRKHPEYWGGEIHWIGIKDARKNHGQRITDTMQKTNDLGITNSSARILPENTVCLSRTASVGYVLVMGRPMATSQDFVNWVCSNRLAPDFLKYLFLAEGREGLLRFASGSVHQTIYFPEAKAFHICHPNMDEQTRIVDQCDSIREETLRLEANYQQKIEALAELKQSLLQKAFSGELTAEADKLIDEAVA